MSIKVNNITKNYGAQKALNDVSLKIDAGEIVGLVGPNGAGKSTLMKIITCYLPQTSGDAFVCDFNVIEHSLEVRKKVGYLPEHNPLYLDMYVIEFLEFIGGIYKLGKNLKSRVAEMMEITGLELERKKKIGALSKGYRQRVGLAQALIHNPEVLILDEPTSGLDPNQIIEIRNLIKEIGKEKTVLFSTHIMQEVEAICNKVIVIDKGKIVADRTTADMHKFTANVQMISVEFDTKVEKSELLNIPGVLDAIAVKDFLWSIRTEPDKDARPEIFKFAVKHNITVLSMNMEEQSLEETFHQLTQSGIQ